MGLGTRDGLATVVDRTVFFVHAPPSRAASLRRGPVYLAILAAVLVALGLSALVQQVGAQSTTTDICDRTWWVRNKILELTPSDDTCTSVSASELAAITEMDFNGNGTAHLKAGDFDGLTGLEELDLSNIGIARIQYSSGGSGRLKDGLFAELTNLEVLNLSYNSFYPRLEHDAFEGLANLRELDMRSFSRNPAGRTGQGSSSLGSCWPINARVLLHPEYPWNPLWGSPHAFVPLTSLETYNHDAPFDTSRIGSGYRYRPALYATNNYTQPPAAPQTSPQQSQTTNKSPSTGTPPQAKPASSNTKSSATSTTKAAHFD